MHNSAVSAFVAGLLLTALTVVWVANDQDEQLQSNFENDTSRIATATEARLKFHFESLRSIKAMYVAMDPFKQEQFEGFIRELDLGRHPGFQAFEFIRRVPDEESERFIETMRRNRRMGQKGLPPFSIRPPGKRPQYFVIEYIEPLHGNENSFGLDLATSPTQLDALHLGRDTGAITIAAERIRYNSNQPEEAGFSALIPIYRNGMRLERIEQRRAALLGFAAIVFRFNDLMKNVIATPMLRHMAISMHDMGDLSGHVHDKPELLFDSNQIHTPVVPFHPTLSGLRIHRTIEVGGRRWEIQFTALEDSRYTNNNILPVAAAIAGVVISALIALMIGFLKRRHTLEAQLRTSFEEQRALVDNAIAGIYLLKDRKIQRCNRELEEMLGYGPGELIGRALRIMFVSKDSYESFERSAQDALASGRSWTSEWEFLCKDGRTVLHSIHGKAIDPQNLSKGSIWVAQDITDSKHTEAMLKLTLLEQQAIFDNATAGICYVKDRIVQRCNWRLEEIMGFGPGELLGKPTRLYYSSEESWLAHGKLIYPTIALNQTSISEWEYMRKDGSLVWCSLHGKAIDPQDLSKGSIWVVQDITERKRTEAALVEANNRLEQGLADVEQTYRDMTLLSELSGFLQACHTLEEAYARISEYGPRLFPSSAGMLYLIENSRNYMLEKASWGDAPHTRPSFPDINCWAMRRGQPYRLDHPTPSLCCAHVIQDHIGSHFSYACIPLIAQETVFGLLFLEHRQPIQDGRMERRHHLATALAEQAGLALSNIQLRETLRQQSIRDPLTGLYNRRYMDEAIQRELARAKRNHMHFAVGIIDIDHFKPFNDNYGHDAGDHVLQSVALALQESVRQSDMVCRFGGEEFVVLLPDISDQMAQERACHLLQVIRELDLHHKGRALGRLTASFGLAYYPLHGHTSETLIETADAALYEAKKWGRNRLVVSNVHAKN